MIQVRPLIPGIIHDAVLAGRFAGELEAATLSVDISGFSRLTRELMQQPRDGAERLSVILDEVLRPMVRSVHGRGGFVASFAGDGFTAVFPAGSHGRAALAQAAACGRSVAREIEHPGAGASAAGALGVRAGVAAGSVIWEIFGDEALVYGFRGAAIEACGRAQREAPAGEVRAAPGVVLPPPSSTTEGVPEAVPPRPLDAAIVRRFVPLAALEAGARGEFRHVACVFLSVETSEHDATGFADLALAALIGAARLGGIVNKIDVGDKGPMLLALFGAPLAHEDDVARALDFVLGLPRLPAPRWRAGIAYGVVYAGVLGGAERCEYTVIGDAVNVAARLAIAAPWGETWTGGLPSERTRAHRLEPQGVHTLEGLGEVSVERLTARGEGAPGDAWEGPFAGRAAELGALHAALAPLQRGEPAGLVCVFGEAGMGKSRLVHELRRQLEALEAVRPLTWMTCPSDAIGARPLEPFRRGLEDLLEFDGGDDDPASRHARFDAAFAGLLARVPPAWRAALAQQRPALSALLDIDPPLAEQAAQTDDPDLLLDRTVAAYAVLVRALAAAAPLVIQLEDAHWLDPASERLAGELARQPARCAIVATLRYADDGTATAPKTEETVLRHDVHVSTLAGEAVAAIVEHALGGPASAELVAMLAAHTSGNPYFAEQMALDLQERHLLGQGPQGFAVIDVQAGEPGVPASVSAVLVARLDRLPGEVRRAVQFAAVLGREIDEEVLSAMWGEPRELAAHVSRASAERIWMPAGGRLAFHHALLRDAAYDMQLRAGRRELHRRAAEAIEQVHSASLDAHAASLAHHYDEAGDGRAAAWLERAGAQAYEVSALAPARGFFTRALSRLEESAAPGRRAAILRRLGETHALLGDYARAQAAHEEALALSRQSGDPAAQAHALIALGRIAWKNGEYERARTWLVEGQALAIAAGNRAAAADGLRQLGNLAWRLGDNIEARRLLEESLAIDVATGNRLAIALNLMNLGNIATILGDDDEAIRRQRQALAIAREMGYRWGIAAIENNLGFALLAARQDAPAEEELLEAVRVALDIGAYPIALESLAGIARVRANRGAREEALELVALALSHSGCDLEVEDKAVPLRDELIAALGEGSAAALERGRARHLADLFGPSKR